MELKQLILILFIVSTATALKCYICNEKEPCETDLGNSGQLKDCPNTEAGKVPNVCRNITTYDSNQKEHYERDCDYMKKIETGCHKETDPTDFWICTCTGDGCNAGGSGSSSIRGFGLLVGAFSIAIVKIFK